MRALAPIALLAVLAACNNEPPKPKPVETAGVGKYAIRFTWNDGHEHGIYSWEFLRGFCPCAVCSDLRTATKTPGAGVTRTVPH